MTTSPRERPLQFGGVANASDSPANAAHLPREKHTAAELSLSGRAVEGLA